MDKYNAFFFCRFLVFRHIEYKHIYIFPSLDVFPIVSLSIWCSAFKKLLLKILQGFIKN